MSLSTPYEPALDRWRGDRRERSATVERGTLAIAGARLELAAASCRAPRHRINEDAHSALDNGVSVFVVADGVGGGAMAARASRELVDRVHRALDREPIHDAALRAALLDADREVARSIATHTDQVGAATVVLCASETRAFTDWLVAWVGDCRCYRLTANADAEADLLTRDDSYRHLAETPPPGSAPDDPARMVGNGAVNMPNVARVALREDEMLVLCSDGVHKHVEPGDLSRLLGHRALPLPRRCARLVALARARGSVDDATVLVIHRAIDGAGR